MIQASEIAQIPSHLSLVPFRVVSAQPIEESIQQTATEYIKGKALNPCLENFLSRSRPNFKNDLGEDLSSWGADTLDSAIKVT